MKKKRIRKIQGVHDGEHEKKRNSIKENRTQGTILREESNFMIEEQFEEP